MYLFYQKVLSKTGLDKYAVVDVQYSGQVIGVPRGASSTVDSLQLQKNIKELLQRYRLQAAEDSIAAADETKALVQTDSAAQAATVTAAPNLMDKKPTAVHPKMTITNQSRPLKTNKANPPLKKPETVKKTAVEKPRAVMKKR